jgi:hypothetical protein
MKHWLKRWKALFAPGIVEEETATIDRGDDFAPTDTDAPSGTKPEVVVTDEDKKAVGVDKEAAPKEAAPKETAAGEKSDDDKTPRKDTRIPLARHEELLRKERERREAVERELEASKRTEKVAAVNQDIAAAETKLLELETTYAKFVTDGHADKAAATMAEIRKLERSITQAQTAFEIQAAEARAYERVRYDTTVERLEAAYPVLNEDHPDFDQELMAEVVELRNAYIATGKYTRAEAIQKAAKTLVGARTERQKTAVDTEVRVDSDKVKEAAKEDLSKATGDARTAAARAKAADAAVKQPASMNKVGLDSSAMGGTLDAKAVMRMNQDEFSKLDEKTLARLRGDEIV